MRVRQHVNPLGVTYADLEVSLPEIEPGREIELEIGCAEAQFLFERAAHDSSRVYIGLEIREQLVKNVNREATELSVPVHAIFCHANHHLEQLFEPASVKRVYLNFPDPWFKNRHKKRRMIDRELAIAVHRILHPEGELFFQSDVWAVALDTLDILEGLDELYENASGPWSFWKDGNPYGARSWREMHCEEVGLPIWRLAYRPQR